MTNGKRCLWILGPKEGKRGKSVLENTVYCVNTIFYCVNTHSVTLLRYVSFQSPPSTTSTVTARARDRRGPCLCAVVGASPEGLLCAPVKLGAHSSESIKLVCFS